MHTNVKEFQQNIIEYPKESDSQEVLNIIKEENVANEFYQLNEAILNIALNSIKFRDKSTGELKVCNKFTDIDSAYEKLQAFVNKYHVKNYESIIDMVKERYRDAMSRYDKRETTAMINVNSEDGQPDYSSFGYFATYYDLKEIPSWEEIKKLYLERLGN